ncbi:cation-translocating ATPase [Nitzschia inconspicua]|uniref:Cation-translocating ATPase n=1 Tax=Nitzschia inconspicua TaxID=303405 RepID=A0A9K3KZM0_9STRA|nr:cation-translocating ATPase [Nitzschia inconspicua]
MSSSPATSGRSQQNPIYASIASTRKQIDVDVQSDGEDRAAAPIPHKQKDLMMEHSNSIRNKRQHCYCDSCHDHQCGANVSIENFQFAPEIKKTMNLRRRIERYPVHRKLLILLVVGILINTFEFCVALPSRRNQKESSLSRNLQSGLAKKKLQKELQQQKSKLRSQKGADGAKKLYVSSSKSSPTSLSDSISVESFLVPRKVSLRLLLRTVCGALLLWSLLRCLQTSGVPYIRTVWQILYGNEDFTSKVPMDYFPSSADIHLANLIAASSKTFHIMLPSPGMPSAAPILGAVASAFAYIGLTYLLPYWSTRFRVFLDFHRTDSLSAPDSKSSPQERRKLAESALVRVQEGEIASHKALLGDPNYLICPLYQSSSSTESTTSNISQSVSSSPSIRNNFEHPSSCYFEVRHSRIYCDPKSKCCIDGAPTLQQMSLAQLRQLVQAGGLSKQQQKVALERYKPYNTVDLTLPRLCDVFFSRISSPLVVVEFLGKLMSVVEEGKGALFALMGSLAEHYWDAQQAIQSAEQMAQEVQTNLQDTSGYKVLVYQSDKDEWIPAVAGDLVPGDLFRLENFTSFDADGNFRTDELIVPVDALVLKGQCLTNEAVLTGESVPQVKVHFDFPEESSGRAEIEETLDVNADRSSILFAGTTLLPNGISLHSGNSTGLVCLALRTGTYSSKGQLLKALKGNGSAGSVSNARVGKDAMRLIGAMSIFAAVSCASLFVRRDGKVTKVSPFRRVVQCTRIVLASIPSSLPLALAAVTRSCSRMLRNRSDVVCSEPGSLLTAAYVDTVVFDKTGTLTADSQSLSKLVKPCSTREDITEEFQRCLLAGCHSLVNFLDPQTGKQYFVGDPLDDASLRFSGWKFNQTSDMFFLPTGSDQMTNITDAVRMWQIRTFPFDPNRRLSTAVVLIERKDSSLELWKFTKGAPDTLRTYLDDKSEDSLSNFDLQRKELERKGYRSIAMGAENLTNSSLSDSLFPGGLSSSSSDLAFARSQGDGLRRDEVESVSSATEFLTNCGFACFDASLRMSSQRVVRELKEAGVTCIMLTGDSVDAALNVAMRARIVTAKKVAILELSENSRQAKVSWRVRDAEADGNKKENVKSLTAKSVRKFLSQYTKGKVSLLASGDAIDYILRNVRNDAHQMLIQNLGSVSVIARATPELKRKVIVSLKEGNGKTVMMCGDGVNDVAAIQVADVAAALLNGFGTERDINDSRDIDDERRKEKLKAADIGNNRRRVAAETRKSDQNDALARIRKRIEKSHDKIKEKVLRRQNASPSEERPQYTFDDMKEMLSATYQAYCDERERMKKLRKGGSNAARILAEERSAILSGKSTSEDQSNEETELTSKQNIKPGEVSLVSSFSCLHPSVDGVDAILREGVATAAAAIATQQLIALHSLMSAFHLATLYRDGFRYSSKMWFAEVFLSMKVDSLRYGASCIPRPRLPSSVHCRPPQSIFETGSLVFTILQAMAHLLFMSWGVSYVRGLQGSTIKTQVERIGIKNVTPFGTKLEKFVNILSSSPLHKDNEDEKKPFSFLRQSPFQPNYETNVVFMFSVLQNALSTLVTHQGEPFYQSVLENRPFCKILCFTIVFFTICVTDLMPQVTEFLDVKPFPSRRSKLVLVGLALGNAAACLFARWIGSQLLSEIPTYFEKETASDAQNNNDIAADLEEKLLREEAEINARGIRMCLAVLVYFFVYFLVDMISSG